MSTEDKLARLGVSHLEGDNEALKAELDNIIEENAAEIEKRRNKRLSLEKDKKKLTKHKKNRASDKFYG